jgi:hypothetical protein
MSALTIDGIAMPDVIITLSDGQKYKLGGMPDGITQEKADGWLAKQRLPAGTKKPSAERRSDG